MVQDVGELNKVSFGIVIIFIIILRFSVISLQMYIFSQAHQRLD